MGSKGEQPFLNVTYGLDLIYMYTKYHQNITKGIRVIVGEPKSRIMQKHIFFAPKRYTVGILYTDSLNSAWYETTV